jgi:hypothetical protein
MFTKLLSLIVKIIFYEVDLGVDIKVANQQHNIIFPNNPTICAQADKLLNRTFYVHSYNMSHKLIDFQTDTIEYLYYEPMHFLITTAWLVLG